MTSRKRRNCRLREVNIAELWGIVVSEVLNINFARFLKPASLLPLRHQRRSLLSSILDKSSCKGVVSAAADWCVTLAASVRHRRRGIGETLAFPCTGSTCTAKLCENDVLLADEMKLLFGDVVTSGLQTWAPSSGVLSEQPELNKYLKGSGDSEEDPPVAPPIDASTQSSEATRKGKGKRVEAFTSTKQSKK